MTRRPLARRSSLNATVGTRVGTRWAPGFGWRRRGASGSSARRSYRLRRSGRSRRPLDIGRRVGVRYVSNTQLGVRRPHHGRPPRHPLAPRRDDRAGEPARPRPPPPGAGPIVEWDVRTAYDFVFALSDDAGSTDDLPPADRTWLADGKARAACASLGDATRPVRQGAVHRPRGPRRRPPRGHRRRELRRRCSAASRTTTIVRLIVGEDLRDPEPRRDRGAGHRRRRGGDRGDARARSAATRRPGARQLAVALYREPALDDRAGQSPSSTAWLPTFQAIEPRVGAMIRARLRGPRRRPRQPRRRRRSSSGRPAASAGSPSRASGA